MTLLAAVLLGVFALEPARSPSRDAQVHLECPDVPALVRAYGRAPLASLLADPALQKLLPGAGRTAAGPPTLARLALPALAPDSGLDVDEALSVLSALASASLSIGGLDPGAKEGIGVQLELAFSSDEAAVRAASWLDAILPRAASGEEAGGTRDALEGAEREHVIVQRRIAAPMQRTETLAVWQSRRGNEVVIGYGSSTAEAWLERVRTATDESKRRERWAPASEWTASSGTTVLHAELAIDVPPSTLPFALPVALYEPAAAALLPFLGSRGRWRVELRGDRFVTEGVTTRLRAVPAADAWCCEQPLSANAPRLVPSSAVGAWITSVRPAILEAYLRGWIVLDAEAKEAAPESELPSLDASLGSSAAVCMMPLVNLQRLIPPLMIELELADARAFETAWTEWSAAILRARPGWSMQKKPYHDVPVYIFRASSEDQEARATGLGPFQLGTVQPSLAVLPDRLVIALVPSVVRAEIARLEKSAGDLHAIATGRFPEDAIDVGTIDWASALGRLYDAARGLLPLLAQNGGGLPFDPAALPPAASWTRHFRPSIAWTRRAGVRQVHYSESSWGPETPLALAAFAISLARSLEAPSVTPPVTPSLGGEPAEPPAATPEHAETERRLRDLAVGLTVYRGVHGGLCPSGLAELVRPADGFPRGFLDTESVPQDGWSRSFSYTRAEDGRSYRLWSLGADGVDQSGAGDDVRLP